MRLARFDCAQRASFFGYAPRSLPKFGSFSGDFDGDTSICHQIPGINAVRTFAEYAKTSYLVSLDMHNTQLRTQKAGTCPHKPGTSQYTKNVT